MTEPRGRTGRAFPTPLADGEVELLHRVPLGGGRGLRETPCRAQENHHGRARKKSRAGIDNTSVTADLTDRSHSASSLNSNLFRMSALTCTRSGVEVAERYFSGTGFSGIL